MRKFVAFLLIALFVMMCGCSSSTDKVVAIADTIDDAAPVDVAGEVETAPAILFYW